MDEARFFVPPQKTNICMVCTRKCDVHLIQLLLTQGKEVLRRKNSAFKPRNWFYMNGWCNPETIIPFIAIQKENPTLKTPKHLFCLLWMVCNVLLLHFGLKYLSPYSLFIFFLPGVFPTANSLEANGLAAYWHDLYHVQLKTKYWAYILHNLSSYGCFIMYACHWFKKIIQ